MVWSHWRKAISRGALLVLLCWSGVAWTQAPDEHAAPAASERIMVVHENGKSTRCRVVESWKLPDGRLAHLLQSVETGNMITIVDDHAPTSEQTMQLQKNPRAMPKRIFLWGQNRNTPPEGSPIPPHLRFDSGLVLRNETPPPADAQIQRGPDIVNRIVDEKAIGKSFGTQPDGVQRLAYANEPPIPGNHPMIPPAANSVMPASGTQDSAAPSQVVPAVGCDDKNTPTNAVLPAVVNGSNNAVTIPVIPAGAVNDPQPPTVSPSISTPPMTIVQPTNAAPTTVNPFAGPDTLTIVQTPAPTTTMPALPTVPSSQPETLPTLPTPAATVNQAPTLQPAQVIGGGVEIPMPATNLPPRLPPDNGLPTLPKTEPQPLKNSQPFAPTQGNGSGSSSTVDKVVTVPATPSNVAGSTDPYKSTDSSAKGWQFGDRLRGLFGAKTTPPTEKKDEPKKVVEKTKPIEDFLPAENKVVEKTFEKKIDANYKAPFSTAMGASPSAVAPNSAKQDATPLVIPTPPAGDKKDPPAVLPDLPANPKQADIAPSTPPAAQREMWGTAKDNSVQSPGKFVFDSASKSSVPERANDPLMSPERLNPGSKLGPKYAQQDSGRSIDVNSAPRPGEPRPAPLPETSKFPPGTQSVLAARMGTPGPVIYVPVPTVTVPQTNAPPYPPEPKMPDAPQLNAFVNAFSPDKQPMAAQQGPAPILPPQQPMAYGPMTPQAMAPNPMLAQQMYQQQMAAQMYQQQMMQQQMQQQAMMQQQQGLNPTGYQPYPAPANGFVPPQGMMMPGQAPPTYPQPTQVPGMNFSRAYQGPQAPNPFAANPSVQTGITPVSFQQTAVTPQYAVAAQVEQTIRVLRESPYPAQREWAAQTLLSFDWRSNPQLVPVLLQAATQDPAPTVRAGAVYCLGRMKASVEPVITTLQMLRRDADPRVRQEVEQAFVRLSQP